MSLEVPEQTQRWSRLHPDMVGDAELVLCDLDGCLISEARIFPEVPDFISALGDRLWILSNNSTATAATLAAELAELGLGLAPERILLAGETTLLRLAQELPEKRLRLHATPALHQRARDLGLDPSYRLPEAVLLCRDFGFGLGAIGTILEDVAAGATLWLANPDRYHPGRNGRRVAETGALLAALLAVEPELDWVTLGKPQPDMLEEVLRRVGLPAANAVFIGDNPHTDGAAAQRAGIPFARLDRRQAT